MKKSTTIIICVLCGIFILLMIGPFFIVEEGEQVVVTRFGRIVREEKEAGLKLKIPFIDTVVSYSKKILSWDGEAQTIPTKEKQYIWVDVTARWRVADVTRFYSAVTTMDRAIQRLDEIIDSAVRTTISSNSLHEALRNSNIINEVTVRPELVIPEGGGEDLEGIEDLSQYTSAPVKQDPVQKGRKKISDEIYAAVQRAVPDFGVEIVDIVVRQIRYSDQLTESVYNRMIKERNQIAQAARSFGEGRKQSFLGQTEKEKVSILSRAHAQAENIKGGADAQAAQIYSRAYNADPEFFQFWRAIESYRTTLPKFNKTLTTDMNYFNYLYNPSGGR
jgi:membrane protease subunit HflC